MAQTQQIGRHATTVSTDEEGLTNVCYHSTNVVSFDDYWVKLRTGGWRTITTKLRMNQASWQFKLGYKVFQKDYSWYVQLPNGNVEDFTGDSFAFYRDEEA